MIKKSHGAIRGFIVYSVVNSIELLASSFCFQRKYLRILKCSIALQIGNKYKKKTPKKVAIFKEVTSSGGELIKFNKVVS